MRQAEDEPPAPPERRIIERPRLLRQLEETKARTILLIAPAGYGKTTLARQWARERDASWLSATSGSTDIAVLARQLADALASRLPSLGQKVDETIRVMQNPARELGNLSEVFGKHLRMTAEISLVIDDYHVLDDAPLANKLVNALREPPGLRLLIASRTRPQWVTAREHIYGETFELRRDELALDPSETAQLIRDPSPIQEILDRANGWPAVIGLAAIASAPGAPRHEAISQTLYDFLAEESFNNADQSVQDALFTMALLPSLGRSDLVSAFGDSAARAASEAARTGLVERFRDGVALHPLAREFLFDKIRSIPGSDERIRNAVEHDIEHSAWDQAFTLIATFQLRSVLDHLITASFGALLASGRVETLKQFSRFAITFREPATPTTHLVDAEIALRDAFPEQAQRLAVSAADRLPPSHSLKARAYLVGGAAALVRFDLEEARRLHSLALDFAHEPQDQRDALWGHCLALIYLEDDASIDAAHRLSSISSASIEDRLRASTAELLVSRSSRGLCDVGPVIAAQKLLAHARDPRARTSFGNVCSYVLALQGRYEDADTLINDSIADAEAYGLHFAKPHLHWTKAFVALGLRRFSQADRHLRVAEVAASGATDAHLELNIRSLRARILLAENRADQAVETTTPTWQTIPTRAMYAEYLATHALALAVVGDSVATRRLVLHASRLSSVVEVQTLTATTEAVAAIGTRRARAAAVHAFDLATRLDTWDALICGMRCMPQLLEDLAARETAQRRLVEILELSNDHSLLKSCGLSRDRTYGKAGILSRREREVIDLMRQGLTNREIGRTLYVSEGTAKTHVEHILGKLGARTRAEAVARYALSADESTGA